MADIAHIWQFFWSCGWNKAQNHGSILDKCDKSLVRREHAF